MRDKNEFERIVSADVRREDDLLLPIMSDLRIGQLVLAATVPQLGIELDVEKTIGAVAVERGVEEDLVREALARAKDKFEREQSLGW